MALGIMMCVQSFYTIEWSFPYCLSQADGPASAVFGMPLPYIRWSGSSSLEYWFMPLVYVINVLALSALAWPFTRLFLRLLGGRPGIRTSFGLIGLTLALLVTASLAFSVCVKAYRPTASLRLFPYDTYFDLRPIRFTVNDLHYQCTPSPAWFPDRSTTKQP